jgi:hypothetical protein
MPIYKSVLTTNFSQTDNDLFNDGTMPFKAKYILVYLLSKPAHWQLKISDIKKRCNLGTHSVRQALKWLQQAGFMFYERLTSLVGRACFLCPTFSARSGTALSCPTNSYGLRLIALTTLAALSP